MRTFILILIALVSAFAKAQKQPNKNEGGKVSYLLHPINSTREIETNKYSKVSVN